MAITSDIPRHAVLCRCADAQWREYLAGFSFSESAINKIMDDADWFMFFQAMAEAHGAR